MRLRYSKRALQQIETALDYIEARSPQGAALIERRIVTMLALLRDQPHVGRKTSIPRVRRESLAPYPS